MRTLPVGTAALVVRTDFTDDALWEQILVDILRPTEEDFRAAVHAVNDSAFRGLDPAAVLARVAEFANAVDADGIFRGWRIGHQLERPGRPPTGRLSNVRKRCGWTVRSRRASTTPRHRAAHPDLAGAVIIRAYAPA
ncbi:DUF6924 domain-containing protein [Actinophytocola sp. NPDC049390]|uniref:DUF6924 domain-containing protein n=1 Tax=Actinophytocola sp. NPDC049390 TaxID=3363894 RepID=UPI0037915A08